MLCVIQGASDCKTAPPLPPVPQADRTLYDTILTHPLKAVAELNNVREITSSFQAMLSMFKAYPSGECMLIQVVYLCICIALYMYQLCITILYLSAGIQMWVHNQHAAYKCHGPYIPDWKCCSASWVCMYPLPIYTYTLCLVYYIIYCLYYVMYCLYYVVYC